MKEEYETKAYFWVRGFEPPYSQISEIMELEPTEAWHKGDPGKYIPQQKQSNWQLHSPLSKNEVFLDSHIKALLEILESKKEKIKKQL